MTPSTANELQSASASPIADQGDDGDAVNDDQGQNWLTIRRRCELCKQRKVRFSNTVAGLELARFKLQTCCESHIFKAVGFGWRPINGSPAVASQNWVSGCVGRRPPQLVAPEPNTSISYHYLARSPFFHLLCISILQPHYSYISSDLSRSNVIVANLPVAGAVAMGPSASTKNVRSLV